MRVLVCGGRDYADVAAVRAFMSKLAAKHPAAVVIHGAARGADELAGREAARAGLAVEAWPADWSRGKRGGPERNAQMIASLSAGDVVVAFPGGRGTADCCRQARTAGIPVHLVI
jgi:regulator of RNase E activity RraA